MKAKPCFKCGAAMRRKTKESLFFKCVNCGHDTEDDYLEAAFRFSELTGGLNFEEFRKLVLDGMKVDDAIARLREKHDHK